MLTDRTLVRFRRLNASTDADRETRSFTGKLRIRRALTDAYAGPVDAFRPRLPARPRSGTTYRTKLFSTSKSGRSLAGNWSRLLSKPRMTLYGRPDATSPIPETVQLAQTAFQPPPVEGDCHTTVLTSL